MADSTFDNAPWPWAEPRLSVLIPFLRDDPAVLLKALDAEGEHLLGKVELVILDDGTGDAALTERLQTQIAAMNLPVRLVTFTTNQGRSKGRNILAGNARGKHLLFLDSDMLPDDRDFLSVYVGLIDREDPAVAFGGFSLFQAPERAEHALHRAMALKSDCLPATERRLAPEKYVFTSNLLVRRDVFEAEAFDEAFVGWGWEDVEWAMRVARRWPIVHVDNTATHLGLDRASAMAAKYEQSAANFARVVASHHAVVSTYPSYRVARTLRRVPLRPVWRPTLKWAALSEPLPIGVRALAMRLYRAALYAEAV
ncbi:polysaccharide biosynthesis protein HfsG [soil metagenome]